MSEYMRGAIIVWRFRDAPRRLRDLSKNGGDEDWLAVVPGDDYPNWLNYTDSCHDPQVCPHPDMDGFFVVIGSHA